MIELQQFRFSYQYAMGDDSELIKDDRIIAATSKEEAVKALHNEYLEQGTFIIIISMSHHVDHPIYVPKHLLT